MLHTKIIDIKKEKILMINAEKFLKSSKFGASIFFKGTVRDINENKKVTGITYDSHDQLVLKSFKKIYYIHGNFNICYVYGMGVYKIFYEQTTWRL